MQLVDCEARPHWREQAAELGYLYAILENPPYWAEALPQPFYCEFSQSEVRDLIIPASRELVNLAHQALEFICFGPDSENQFDRLKIPREFRQAIRESWRRRDPSLYGRIDFCMRDGKLKLLELNFDVAASLYEASVLQWIWLKERKETGKTPEHSTQFNRIQEMLVERFKMLASRFSKLHFASSKGFTEDEDTCKYLQSCATIAGIETKYGYMLDLGYDSLGQLVDKDDEPIEALFKFYPWEDFIAEELKGIASRGMSVIVPLVERNDIAFIEPLWRCALSDKGIMAIMYELHPECKWLLETYFEDDPKSAALQEKTHVRKPLFGREGGSVAIIHPDAPERTILNPSGYGREGFVIQEFSPLPEHRDYHLLIGSWVIGDQPAGLGVRADLSPITTAANCLFIPHQITG